MVRVVKERPELTVAKYVERRNTGAHIIDRFNSKNEIRRDRLE